MGRAAREPIAVSVRDDGAHLLIRLATRPLERGG